ncbi:MAG: radical SAM protein [Nanobdellota archaeon]
MHITLTTKCNNNCLCCVAEKKLREKEVRDSYPKIKDKEKMVVLSGGEPTLSKNFFKAIKDVNNSGSSGLILSNARAFSNKNFFEKFESCNINKERFIIATALYSDNEPEHDAMTRTKKSFKQAVTGLKKLISKGYNAEVRIIITKLNYSKLEKISQFIKKEFQGAKRIVFIQMKIDGEALSNINNLFISYKKTIEPIKNATKVIKKTNIKPIILHLPLCFLPKELHKHTKGKTAPEEDIYFPNECRRCEKKSKCCGFWKGYIEHSGEKPVPFTTTVK